jgi:uncharacterized SAM-binding protein YcdF (DUF218 family)
MNDLLRTLELGSLKGWIASAVLPPVPFIVLMLVGVWILRRKPWRAWTCIVVSALGIYFSTTTLLGWALIQGLLRPPPALSTGAIADLKSMAAAQKTAIVVLGAGRELFAPEYNVSNLTPLSIERLRYGVWLSRATNLPLAFSGGIGHGALPGSTEAEIAARVAANEFGRPLRWTETQSRDTSENAHYSVALLSAQGIERIVLVTHGFHMRRAVANFERAAARAGVAITVQPAPMGLAKSSLGWVPTMSGFFQTRVALREWLGWLAGA